MKLNQRLLILMACLIPQLSYGDDGVSGALTRVGDAAHAEFTGRKSWNYDIRKENQNIIINLPPLTDKTKAQLTSWSDSFVSSVRIEAGPDGGNLVTFTLAAKDVEHFDYISDQPSRLIVDFYKNPALLKNKKTSVASTPVEVKLPPKKVEKQKERVIASEAKESESFPADGEKTDVGVFDSADSNYSRFQILPADIKEEAIIASRGNIYLQYPILDDRQTLLKELQENPPIYEIQPEDTDENKKARLLLTLFGKNRPAVFSKSLEFFEKQYPKSQYIEMIQYLKADLAYADWKKSQLPEDLNKALKLYEILVETYPESVLAERTSLFVGYSYFDRGDYLSSIKYLSKFEKKYPDSKYRPQVRVALADAYRGLRKYGDTFDILRKLEADPASPDYHAQASFKMGDVHFYGKSYKQAVESYTSSLEKYKTAKKANPYYNLAESYFWLGKYKESLDAHRKFLTLFPRHEYGNYSMVRVGELLEILGADRKKVDGAYLETIFRYKNSEGAGVARIRLTGQRIKDMKEKEIDAALLEINKFVEKSTLPRIKDFVSILVSDGYRERREYQKAFELLTKFYNENPEADLSIFRKRIVQNLTSQLSVYVQKGQFMDFFKAYGKDAPLWLKNPDRIDIDYYQGRSFEQAGVSSEAATYYRKVLNRLYAIKGTDEEKERMVMENIPSTDTVNLRLAAMSYQEKDYGQAVSYLDAIQSPYKLSPDEQVERIEAYANVFIQKGSVGQAKKYLSDLITNWKGRPGLVSAPLVKLSELQIEGQEYERAELNLQKVILMEKDSEQVPKETVIHAMELKGNIQLKQKKYEAAAATYRKLLEKYEEDFPLEAVRYRLGKLHFEQGNMVEAEKSWSTLKENSTWAKMAKEQLEHSKWNKQYKKYIQRIPSMADDKGEKQ
ncbi:MAG: tetratricopeptide repeat protein [Bdellovibrionales bacterium]